MSKNGFIQEDNIWYFYKDDEKLCSQWVQEDGKEPYYYLEKDGRMVTGWFQTAHDGDRWFYAYPERIEKSGKTHYTGEMATGWIFDKNSWYYLYPDKTVYNGKTFYKGEMAIGWIKIGKEWYYTLSDGKMVENCTMMIDGKNYTFNSKGILTEDIVTLSQLKELGFVNAEVVIKDLNRCCNKFNINTPERLRHFISQCCHESGGGRWIKEIASGTAYEWRSDLGNTQAGDGKKYKGAGYIQLTGRRNYQNFANYINDQKVMQGVDYVSKNYPWMSAGYFWYKSNLNDKVDKGYTVEQVTRVVNGGTNGLLDRKSWYNKCCKIFK